MVQLILLISVLATLDSFNVPSMAAPVSSTRSTPRHLEWWAAESVASTEAAATDEVVEFAPQATITLAPELESTVTYWETKTITTRPTATTVPNDGLGAQTWVLPETFADLSPFGAMRIAYGSPNIAVVTGIPARASATSPSPGSPTPAPSLSAASLDSVFTSPELPRPWTNTSAAYRLFFPSGSINPKNKPQGGSDFYASPVSLQNAKNVTMEYSVFFPADFEWVHGGKLPGLYGGHAGCSGGNDAKSCFSTRMMWRQGGAGELYLYAPKDKQTPALCQAPPQSVCDATYGLSIGRGSFHFAAGAWTHISQTVRLNTPGKQDGGFELIVNGRRIMRRDDIFYRDVPSSLNHNEGGSGGNGDSGGNDDGDDNGGGDGGNGDWDVIGGGLLGDLLRRNPQAGEMIDYGDIPSLLAPPGTADVFAGGINAQAPLFSPDEIQTEVPKVITGNPKVKFVILPTTVTEKAHDPTATAPAGASHVNMESQGDVPNSIGFSGIFFSTFFGGHEQSWASPRDQYAYFKDFGLSINA